MKRVSSVNIPYGIVGDGKASKHLQAYFRLLKTPCILWRRSSGRPLQDVLERCGKIFILIKDSEIGPFICRHPFLKSRTLFHFSGSIELDRAFGLHPFMPFSERVLTLEQYRNIPFALSAGAPPLKELVPEFSNPYFRVRKGRKPLYHALCVLGGNLPFILWQKALEGLRGEFKVPEKHIRAYFRAALDNFENDPAAGLSGPLRRKDMTTIRANLKALKGDPFRGVYAAFVRAFVKG